MKTINLQDLQIDIGELLAEGQGEPIVITSGGKPLTVLVPLQSTIDEQFNVQVDDQIRKIVIQTATAKPRTETYGSEDMKRAIGVSPDIIVTKGNDRVIAVVEVKYHSRVSLSEAISIRRHLLFDIGKMADYFFLITPKLGFVWDQKTNKDPEREPDFRFSIKDFIDVDVGIKSKRADKAIAFEEAVAKWLTNFSNNTNNSMANLEAPIMRDLVNNLRGSDVHVAD